LKLQKLPLKIKRLRVIGGTIVPLMMMLMLTRRRGVRILRLGRRWGHFDAAAATAAAGSQSCTASNHVPGQHR
jgi:hypothetical protein